MKGILHKTDKGWMVEYRDQKQAQNITKMKYSGIFAYKYKLLIHPDQQPLAGFHYTKELEGKEVEFEVVNGESWTDAPYGAKLILPKAPTETWEDIYRRWQRSAYFSENHEHYDTFLRKFYHPPIKK